MPEVIVGGGKCLGEDQMRVLGLPYSRGGYGKESGVDL